MAAVGKLEFSNVFADETTAKITIDNVNPSFITPTQLESIRSQVMAFNDNQGGTLAPKMKSKNGFDWIGIKSVAYTTTDKTVIF